MKIFLFVNLFIISLSALCFGIEYDYEHIEARNLSDRDPDRLNLDDLRREALITSALIKLYDQNSAIWPNKRLITELAGFSQKRMDPEYQMDKFSQATSNLDFSQVKYVSKIIMSRGSDDLKKTFMSMLYKYKDKSMLCAFELGKILYYGQIDGRKEEKEGLIIIKPLAEKGLKGAVDFLIVHYENSRNGEKEFYYLEKSVLNGARYEKLIDYCIEKKYFTKARKYLSIYIKNLEQFISDLKDGTISVDNSETRDRVIQFKMKKIKKYENILNTSIKNAKQSSRE